MLARLCSSYEFLRSDEVIDRIEFIKWAATTNDDCGLLIAILERLVEIRREGDIDEVLTHRPDGNLRTEEIDHYYRGKNLLGMLCQLGNDVFADIFLCGNLSFRCKSRLNYRDFEWGKLDPVRFVRVYRYLKQLHGHVYNIHEAACLEQTGESTRSAASRKYHSQSLSERDKMEMDQERAHRAKLISLSNLNPLLSIMAIATQIVFIVFIINGTVSALGDLWKERDMSLLISNCIITVATITIFLGFVLENYVAAYRATHVIQALRVRRAEYLGERFRRDFSLLLNLIGNGLLGYFLFCLNIPFVLSAESVTDAILNSLATIFLLEIDDRIKPLQSAYKRDLWQSVVDFDNDVATTNMYKLAHNYLYFKRDTRIPDAVEVTKILKTLEETRDSDLRLTYSPQDYCRIYVDEWNEDANKHHGGASITVFRLANERMFPSVYEEIIYKINGPGAKEFVENVQHFCRAHVDSPDSVNEFSRKRALREIGQRRSRSVLRHVLASDKVQGQEYLQSIMEDEEDKESDQNFYWSVTEKWGKKIKPTRVIPSRLEETICNIGIEDEPLGDRENATRKEPGQGEIKFDPEDRRYHDRFEL